MSSSEITTSLMTNGKTLASLLHDAKTKLKTSDNNNVIFDKVESVILTLLGDLKNDRGKFSTKESFDKVIDKIVWSLQEFMKLDPHNASKYDHLVTLFGVEFTPIPRHTIKNNDDDDDNNNNNNNNNDNVVDDRLVNIHFLESDEIGLKRRWLIRYFFMLPRGSVMKKKDMLLYDDRVTDLDKSLKILVEANVIEPVAAAGRLRNKPVGRIMYKMTNAAWSTLVGMQDFVNSFRKRKKMVSNYVSVVNIDEPVLDARTLNWVTKHTLYTCHLGNWNNDPTKYIVVEDVEALAAALKIIAGHNWMTCLSLRGISGIVELPNAVYKQMHLRILNLRGCHNLELLPKGIDSLSELQYLDISECYLLDHIPKGIARLSELRVLKGFIIVPNEDSSAASLTDLTSLKKLFKLTIRTRRLNFLTKSDLETLCTLPSLIGLKITWVGACSSSSSTNADFDVSSKFPAKVEKFEMEAASERTKTRLLTLIANQKSHNLKKLYIKGGDLRYLNDYKESTESTDIPDIECKILRLQYLPTLKTNCYEMMRLFPKLHRAELSLDVMYFLLCHSFNTAVGSWRPSSPERCSYMTSWPESYPAIARISEFDKSDYPAIARISDKFQRPLFSIVEDSIHRATHYPIGEFSQDALMDSAQGKRIFDVVNPNWKGIDEAGKISYQMTKKILDGNDAHRITKWVLECLNTFSWGDKLILTLLGFALTYADFWLLIRIYANNAINEPLTADQEETASVNKEAYIKQLEANNDFINDLVTTASYIFEIQDIEETPDQIPGYVYDIIRSVIVAATQIMILSSRGFDQYVIGIPDPLEYDRLKSLCLVLRKSLDDLHKRKGVTKQIDSIAILRTIISQDNDYRPLYHGVTKKTVQLEMLRRKHLLLLISGPDISLEDVASLKQSISGCKTHETVWIPISNSKTNDIERLQNTMPWYIVHEPLMVVKPAIMHSSQWDFNGRPILVNISPQGEVLNRNAIHMVRIWRDQLPADDFTTALEQRLWEKETWNLQFLVDHIDPIIQQWIDDEKYIYLYGGNDIEWIRKFARQAKYVARELGVEMEMVYVGNNHTVEQDHNMVRDMILTDDLSYCWPESSRAYFWLRIDSMIYSKAKLGKMNDKSDNLLHEIVRLHSHKEWALLAKGSRMVHGPGRNASTALEDMNIWRENGIEPGYVNHCQVDYNSVHHCHELVLPAYEKAPDSIICPNCHRNMELRHYFL